MPAWPACSVLCPASLPLPLTLLFITLSLGLCTSLAVIVYPFFLILPGPLPPFPSSLPELPSLSHVPISPAFRLGPPLPVCPHVFLSLSLLSLGRHPSYPSQSPSSLLWLPNPGSPEKTSRLEVHWWLLGAQDEGTPPPRKGVEGQ